MNILIIDNGTSYLPQLEAAVAGHEIETVRYSDIPDEARIGEFDAIILSGGHSFPVVGNQDRLQRELELIARNTKPMLGICYGFELIAVAFGASLEHMPVKEKGVIGIEIVGQDALFEGVRDFRVFENHRWVVHHVGGQLAALARSKDGIEVIRHADLPVYGVQFHPEMTEDSESGKRVLRNFLDIARQQDGS